MANRVVVDAAGQVQVLHLEAAVGRVAAQAERGERRAEVAGAGVSRSAWLGMQTYGGRLFAGRTRGETTLPMLGNCSAGLGR